MKRHLHTRSARQSGMSLIEIMVGILIAMVAAVGILKMYATDTIMQKSTAGGSDAAQTGAMTAQRVNALMQQIGGGMAVQPRTNSGTGAQKLVDTHLLGCSLSLQTTAGGTLLPPASLPAPFNTVPTALRLTPVMVVDGGSGSDILVTMGAESEGGNMPMDIQFSVDRTRFRSSTPAVGVNPGDWVLTFDRANVAVPGTCPLYRVANNYTLNYDNTTAVLGSRALNLVAGTFVPLDANFGTPAVTTTYNSLIHLGALPNFKLLSVNDRSQLVSYDLTLPANSSASAGRINPVPIAENVYMVKFLLGVDSGTKGGAASGTPSDGAVDDWVLPGTPGWTADAAGLLKGDYATEGKLHQIVALRYAIVMRSNAPSRDQKSTSLELFPSMNGSGFTVSSPTTISIPAALAGYQFHVYEGVVSLLNMKNY